MWTWESGHRSHREPGPGWETFSLFLQTPRNPLGRDEGAGGEGLPFSLHMHDALCPPPLPHRAQQLLEVQEKGLPSSRHRGSRSNVSGTGPAGKGLGRGAARGGL